MFTKYCVFFRFLKNIPDYGLSLFSLGVSVCTHTRQVESQRCGRTGRVQKNYKILRKNTIFNEHPVSSLTPSVAQHLSATVYVRLFRRRTYVHSPEKIIILCKRALNTFICKFYPTLNINSIRG